MTRKGDSPGRLVYSTEGGIHCPRCERPQEACVCAAAARAQVLGDGNVKVRRETKGRGGKTVTTISGLAMNKDQLSDLLKSLKQLCGTGGSEKDGVLEVQGDHCDKVLGALLAKGIKAKRAGG